MSAPASLGTCPLCHERRLPSSSSRTARLNIGSHIRISDRVVGFSDRHMRLTLRLVSKSFRDKVDARFFRHLYVSRPSEYASNDESDVSVDVSCPRGRVPAVGGFLSRFPARVLGYTQILSLHHDLTRYAPYLLWLVCHTPNIELVRLLHLPLPDARWPALCVMGPQADTTIAFALVSDTVLATAAKRDVPLCISVPLLPPGVRRFTFHVRFLPAARAAVFSGSLGKIRHPHSLRQVILMFSHVDRHGHSYSHSQTRPPAPKDVALLHPQVPPLLAPLLDCMAVNIPRVHYTVVGLEHVLPAVHGVPASVTLWRVEQQILAAVGRLVPCGDFGQEPVSMSPSMCIVFLSHKQYRNQVGRYEYALEAME